MMTHPGIDALQIAAGTHGARVIRRQGIKPFRLDETFHFPTSSKAP